MALEHNSLKMRIHFDKKQIGIVGGKTIITLFDIVRLGKKKLWLYLV